MLRTAMEKNRNKGKEMVWCIRKREREREREDLNE